MTPHCFLLLDLFWKLWWSVFPLLPWFLFLIQSSMSWLDSCMLPLQTCWWNWLGIVLRMKRCLLQWIWNYQSLWSCSIFSHETLITWCFLSLHAFHVEIFQNLGFKGLVNPFVVILLSPILSLLFSVHIYNNSVVSSAFRNTCTLVN